MHKFLHRVLVVLCTLFAIGLLVCYISVYINPERFWLISLFGLSYPVFLIANLFFLVYWIVRWKKLFIIPLAVIVIGIGHLPNFIQLPFGKNQVKKSTDIEVLSYNVNLFRLYSWSQEKPTFNEITDFSKSTHAEIICFQEFYVVNGKVSEKTAIKNLGMNSHIGYSVKKNNSGYGIATFSKYPIVNRGEIDFKNSSNSCIYTDLKIGDDTIRVYNNHLQSLRLQERNINFLLDQNSDKKSSNVAEIKDISFKFRDALKKRALQVNQIISHIQKSPYPVIVCGDFNDSPMSYTYRMMTKNLFDTFKEAGKGIVNTYVRFLPSFRIDYIFHSKELKTLTFSSPKVDFSDHYPVISSFSLDR